MNHSKKVKASNNCHNMIKIKRSLYQNLLIKKPANAEADIKLQIKSNL